MFGNVCISANFLNLAEMFVNFAEIHVKESLGIFPKICSHSSDYPQSYKIREEIKYKKIPKELSNVKPFTLLCVISICVGPDWFNVVRQESA